MNAWIDRIGSSKNFQYEKNLSFKESWTLSLFVWSYFQFSITNSQLTHLSQFLPQTCHVNQVKCPCRSCIQLSLDDLWKIPPRSSLNRNSTPIVLVLIHSNKSSTHLILTMRALMLVSEPCWTGGSYWIIPSSFALFLTSRLIHT